MDRIVRGRILHFLSSAPIQYEYFEDGVLVIEEGKVARLEAAETLAAKGLDLSKADHYPDQLIIPGFVDSHVHAPQLDVMGSFGKQLLDWLNDYTFPLEAKFGDRDYAADGVKRFIDGLLHNGTTTAMVYGTSHKHTADEIFSQSREKNMRMIAGKVLMDRNAPDNLLDTASSGFSDSKQLIRDWHGTGRLGYALTPRFAGTSTHEQMQSVEKLQQAYPDVWMQTHLSENLSEIEWLLSLYPDAKDYLETYERYGMNHEKAVFGHCIHLSDDEVNRLADKGGRIAFCPTSNLFLGSGLFDLEKMRDNNIPVSIATDVGGGTSLCLLPTLAEAYKICQLKGYTLHATDAFCMATLGNAEALHLDSYIGNFAKGKEADFIVLDFSSMPTLKARLDLAHNIEDELFVYMTLGDERLVKQTSVLGTIRYEREAA
jgi:guanine deaminase